MIDRFDDKQIHDLSQPLEQKYVKQRAGSYGKPLNFIETHHAIREANRIFGFDGWSCKTKRLEMLHEPMEYANRNGDVKFICSFIATVEVIAGGVSHDGSGYGNGIANMPQDTYELALKEAESDALKRALKNFGDPFALALYDKEQTHVTSQNVLSYEDRRIAQEEWITQARNQMSDINSSEELDAWWLDHERHLKKLKKHSPDLYEDLWECKEELKQQLSEHS